MWVALLWHVDQEVVLGGAHRGGVEAAVQEASFRICWPVEKRILSYELLPTFTATYQ